MRTNLLGWEQTGMLPDSGINSLARDKPKLTRILEIAAGGRDLQEQRLMTTHRENFR